MKKWLKISLWSLFLIGVIVLLVFIQKTQANQIVNLPEITVIVDGDDGFINQDEVLVRLQRAGLIVENQKNEDLNIEAIEKFISSISQVKTAKVYKNLGKDWELEIVLRKPIARIFNKSSESFYLGSEGYTMSLTPTHTARILVVSGEIEDRKASISVNEIINNDSLKSIRKLDDIYRISSYVCNDPLFSSLIGQVHLEKNGDFVLVPLVGDQKIVFGSAYSEKDVSEKFEKLRIFYEEAISYEGWNTYSEISLKYKDQIVCKKIAL